MTRRITSTIITIAIGALSSGCVIATEWETVVESQEDPVHLQGTHLLADGTIEIQARNPTTDEFEVLTSALADAGPYAVLGTDVHLWATDLEIPPSYWQAGFAGSKAELRLVAKVPGQADFPLDVVTDPDWGACLTASGDDLDAFRDDCTASTGEGLLTITTEDYCLVPQAHWNGSCLILECNGVSQSQCI